MLKLIFFKIIIILEKNVNEVLSSYEIFFENFGCINFIFYFIWL